MSRKRRRAAVGASKDASTHRWASQSVSTLRVVVATTAVQATTSFATLILPAIATIVASALAVDPAIIGLQVSMVYGSAMVTGLYGAQLVRRHGACRTSQFALLLLAAGCGLAATGSLPAIAVASLILGAAYGLPNPAASHLLTRFTEAGRRNLIFSIKQTGVPAGGAAAGLIAPSLSLALGWQAPLLLGAVMALAIALALESSRTRWDDDRTTKAPGLSLPIDGFRLVLLNPPLRWLSIAALLLAIVQFCVITFLVVLLVDEVGISMVVAGAILACVQGAGVAGRIGWGWIADWLNNGIAALMWLTVLLIGGASLVTFFAPTTPIWLVAGTFVLLGATAIGWNGVFLAETARLSPVGRVGEVTACALCFTFAGIFAGPALFSAAPMLFGGYLASYWLIAAAAVLAFLSIGAALSHRRG